MDFIIFQQLRIRRSFSRSSINRGNNISATGVGVHSQFPDRFPISTSFTLARLGQRPSLLGPIQQPQPPPIQPQSANVMLSITPGSLSLTTGSVGTSNMRIACVSILHLNIC
ncbi:unnamed protein product [Protopolystoma xenopodis]|uniref:Uncharacterized protein n=1 Tax=Protopolystoma xenopodis TaxID=117903 RepID=A0A3S4ZQS4_9PLAT|nr:unnamed protein product [Protopolystoma xenopodis]